MTVKNALRNPIIAVPLFGVLGIVCVRIGLNVVALPNVGLSYVVGAAAALLSYFIVARQQQDREFLLKLLVWALALRWLVGLAISYAHLGSWIGPDYNTYDHFGHHLMRTWQGLLDPNVFWLRRYTSTDRSGWGMYYYVAGVYYVLGQVPLAIQLINCSLGALACVLVYKITFIVYPERRVARVAGVLAAVAPSMVLWTSQGIKEAPIVFCLSLAAYCTLSLCQKFKVRDALLLLVALFCLYSLRHYAFYIIFAASAGALLFSAKRFTPARTLQGVALVTTLAFFFAYLGADDVAQSVNIKRIQTMRSWGAKVAESGFGSDVDVTDTRAALTFLPLGVIYVLFAPFPWMVKNRGQLMMLPEMFLWWAAAPLLIRGYWFAFRRRLKESLPLCIFTVGLTLMYALFQSNVGTIHRQRTQIFVFLCIFTSIGYEQWRQTRQAARVQDELRLPRRRASVPAVSFAGGQTNQLRHKPT